MTQSVYFRRKRPPLSSMTRQVLRVLELFLWTLATFALLIAFASWFQSANAQERAKQLIELQRESLDQSLWSAARIEKFEMVVAANAELPVIGILEIASIGLEVAVLDGTTERLLNLGVGRVSGTARIGERGNLAIAGHRDGFFRGLKDIDHGDEIAIRAPGHLSTYRVTEIFVVQPDDVAVLSTSVHDELTLITCYPFYFVGNAPQRYIVRARALDDPGSSTQPNGE